MGPGHRLDKLNQSQSRDLGDFRVGDTIDVSVKIREGNKERVQVFSGICIGRRGRGQGETFMVRRIVAGEGVERVFPVCSPLVESVKVKKRGRIRRSKLYYLRQKVGKATRVREVRLTSNKGEQAPVSGSENQSTEVAAAAE